MYSSPATRDSRCYLQFKRSTSQSTTSLGVKCTITGEGFFQAVGEILYRLIEMKLIKSSTFHTFNVIHSKDAAAGSLHISCRLSLMGRYSLHQERLHYTCNSVKDIYKHVVYCSAGHDVKEFPVNFVSVHVM